MTFEQAVQLQVQRNNAIDDALSLFDSSIFWGIHHSRLDNVILERPEFIDETIWDLVFAKNATHIMNYNSDDFIYCSIENDYIIGIQRPGIFYIFNCPENIDLASMGSQYTKEQFIDRTRYRRIIPNSLKTLYDTAKDMYGFENVCIETSGSNPDLQPLRAYPTNETSCSIFIKHDPFWIEDTFSLKYKLELPITEVVINDTGSISFNFLDLQPDYMAHGKNYNHSHTSTGDVLYLASICRGGSSPINAAISSYVDTPNEDNAYNLFLNYNNLLFQESERGGPHRRMREKFLAYNSNNSSNNLTHIELTDLIKKEIVDVIVNIGEKITVSIDKGSIVRYLSSLTDNLLENQKINLFDNRIYSFNINFTSQYESLCYKTIFNEKVIECRIKKHDISRFDFSGVEDSDQWSNLSKRMPLAHHITNLEKNFSRQLGAHLALNKSTIKLFNYDTNFPKELFGIKEVSRNANIESFF